MVRAGESTGPYTDKDADEIEQWPGTPLSGDDIREGNVLSWTKKPEIEYSWSAGEAISRFLDGLEEKTLLGRECRECDRVLFPPRMFCEECYRNTDEWVELAQEGTIETFSVSYLDTDATRIEDPIVVGVVSLDDAAEGHGIMHYFDEVSKDEIEIGMAVEPVWKPEDDREGSIRDIRYWKPRGDA